MTSRWETHLGGHPSFRGVGVPRRGTTRPRRHPRKSSGLPPPLHNVPTVFLNVNNGCRPCPCHVRPRALSFLFPLGDRRDGWGSRKKPAKIPPCDRSRVEINDRFETEKKKFWKADCEVARAALAKRAEARRPCSLSGGGSGAGRTGRGGTSSRGLCLSLSLSLLSWSEPSTSVEPDSKQTCFTIFR